MECYTTQQVNEQKERFENLLSSCNLAKAGKIIINSMLHKDNWYDYRFVNHYLAINGVCSCMYYMTNPNVFYSDAFKNKAIDAYLKSLK